MRNNLFYLFLVLTLCGLLTACGQTGKLYLPDKNSKVEQEQGE